MKTYTLERHAGRAGAYRSDDGKRVLCLDAVLSLLNATPRKIRLTLQVQRPARWKGWVKGTLHEAATAMPPHFGVHLDQKTADRLNLVVYSDDCIDTYGAFRKMLANLGLDIGDTFWAKVERVVS